MLFRGRDPCIWIISCKWITIILPISSLLGVCTRPSYSLKPSLMCFFIWKSCVKFMNVEIYPYMLSYTEVGSRINFEMFSCWSCNLYIYTFGQRGCFIVTYFIRDKVTNGRNAMEGIPDYSTRRVLVVIDGDWWNDAPSPAHKMCTLKKWTVVVPVFTSEVPCSAGTFLRCRGATSKDQEFVKAADGVVVMSLWANEAR